MLFTQLEFSQFMFMFVRNILISSVENLRLGFQELSVEVSMSLMFENVVSSVRKGNLKFVLFS